MKAAKVITSPMAKPDQNKLYRFRRSYDFKRPQKMVVHVLADARYKLYVNGTLVSVGPCKSCGTEKYYETVEITKQLQDGENIITAEVAQLTSLMDFEGKMHIGAVLRTGILAFALWGAVSLEGGEEIPLLTDAAWKVTEDHVVTFTTVKYAMYVGMNEKVVPAAAEKYEWQNAVELCPVQCMEHGELSKYGEKLPWFSQKRPIPLMYTKQMEFRQLSGGVYDAGELTSGYVQYRCSGNGKIRLTYAESFSIKENGRYVKRDRACEKGEIIGDYDEIILEGQEMAHQTFWMRTFRYIKVETEGSARLESLRYLETGYPLEVDGTYDFGNSTDNQLWDISVRTLKRCMQETYVDCPYYEQLQYAMDTQLQMLFTYQLTGDDRLAKKAIHDFASSQMTDGMIHSRHPSMVPQVIPGFSIFFVQMLCDHYQRFGDLSFVERYLHHVDGVLNWHKYMLGEDGLIKKSRYWNFVDWAVTWEDTAGVPLTGTDEPIAIQSLMYSYALQNVATLCRAAGRSDMAGSYLETSEKLNEAVNRLCFDEKRRLYANGPEKKEFCQHTQVWAVLSGASNIVRGKQIMENSFALEAKATFAFAFYLFRALEKVGLYEKRAEMLEQLRALTKLNCTTVPEIPGETTRSECHAWSAIVLYEYTSVDLGIRKIDAPKKCIEIRPYIKDRDYAKGTIPTVWGGLTVEWSKHPDGNFQLKVDGPDKIKKYITLPDGTREETEDKAGCWTCKMA